MTALRGLRIAAAVEAATVLVLLANLATVHVPAVATLLGPAHGTAYLAGIALTWIAALSRKARVLACLPAVGAWLAIHTTTGLAPSMHQPHPKEHR